MLTRAKVGNMIKRHPRWSLGLSSLICIPLLSTLSCTTVRVDESAPLPEKLDQYFSYISQHEDFHGVVLIARGDEVLLYRGYGKASDERDVDFQADCVLDVGSISKQFTAAGIMKLVEQGKLDVEDAVGKFFPDAPADKAGITLHQLMTHTSGLSHDFAGDFDAIKRDEALARIWRSELSAPPGNEYSYANTGYALLAFVIEQATGRNYFDFMREDIFRPAGMTTTGFYGDAAVKEHLNFTGYMNSMKTEFTALDQSILYGGTLGNGGVLCTAEDMLRWCKAIRGGFFREDIKQRIFKDYGNEYGYGWDISETKYGKRITHNGGGAGGNAYVAMYPEEDIVIIVLSNRIVFRPFLASVSLPADESGKQIMENIMQDNFKTPPRRTFPPWRW